MGEPVLGFGPQGLSLKFSPWATRSSINAAMLYRGAIISAWANVETMLIEVAIRCSLHPAYAKHRDSYPYKLKARITYLREILSLDGPMERYERIGKAVIDRLIKTEKQRNRLAHCAMEAHGNWGIKLHGFEPKDGSEILRWEERVSQEEFCAAAHKAALFSRVVMSLMHRLNDQELLPPLSGAE